METGLVRPGDATPVGSSGRTEAHVVVAFFGRVPVAVRGPAVPGVVVPGAAAQDAARLANTAWLHRIGLRCLHHGAKRDPARLRASPDRRIGLCRYGQNRIHAALQLGRVDLPGSEERFSLTSSR